MSTIKTDFHPQPLKPPFMWAGGKTKLIKEHYVDKIPQSGFAGYVEPFFGGGAMFCEIANKGLVQHAVINDINAELVSVYNAIQSDCSEFIKTASRLARQWNELEEAKRKAWYYNLRAKYWGMKQGTVATAATLYVLMKTSFNGVWQPSKANGGKFGTAVGLLDKKANLDVDLIKSWSLNIQNTTLTSKSYKDIVIPDQPCLIYCDPPYRASYADYGQAFDDAAHEELIKWCRDLASKGHTVVLANRDSGDGFFSSRLQDATVHTFDVTYTVGRKKKTNDGYVATKAREFIALFHGGKQEHGTSKAVNTAVDGNGVVAANDADFKVAA